jgi:hypothetical protein
MIATTSSLEVILSAGLGTAEGPILGVGRLGYPDQGESLDEAFSPKPEPLGGRTF